MKRLLLLSVMFCIGVLQGFAQTFTYTDENGVNWECSLSFDMIPMPDGTYKDTTYVYINSASNYGEEVTVPGVVKYEEKTIPSLNLVVFLEATKLSKGYFAEINNFFRRRIR